MSTAILTTPNRGTLIEGVRLPKFETQCGEIGFKALPKIVQLLPDPTKARQFAMACVAQLNKVEDKCDDGSILNALCNCAGLGLIPGGVLGHAHFVPKRPNRNTIHHLNLWPGYRGYIDLGFETGFLKGLHVDVVFDGEDVEYWTDDAGRHIRHNTITRIDRGEEGRKVRCAYMVYETMTGYRGVEVVSGAVLYALKQSQGNVWHSDFLSMAKKTPIRRGSKLWKLTGRLAYAVRLDEQAERGEEQARDFLIEADVTPARRLPSLSDLPDPDEPVTDVEPEPVVAEPSAPSGLSLRSLRNRLAGAENDGEIAAIVRAAGESKASGVITDDEFATLCQEADDRRCALADPPEPLVTIPDDEVPY